MNIIDEIQTKRIAIKLRPAAEKMVKQGHPWIFEKSISKQNKKGTSGDLVIIYDSKKNGILAIGLYDQNSPIRVKIIHFGKATTIDDSWFFEKINQAFIVRTPLLQTDTNSYRLLFGENDGLPSCIADIYDTVLVLKLYSPIWIPYLNILIPQLIKVSSCHTVVLRLSRSLQGETKKYGLYDGQVLHGNLNNETVGFKEHGILFSANVIKGHKTGYFLDHRHNRKFVGELAKGKKILDVFSYAGGFSVHALAGGATEVVSLDISKQALILAQKNAGLNIQNGLHTVIAADAFKGLQALVEEQRKFDIVVIDPPSFAKKESEIEGAKNSYARLVKLGIRLISNNGILVMASCSSRIVATEFFDIVEENLIQSKRTFKILKKTGHDIDHPITFPEGAYLKCGYYQIQ